MSNTYLISSNNIFTSIDIRYIDCEHLIKNNYLPKGDYQRFRECSFSDK